MPGTAKTANITPLESSLQSFSGINRSKVDKLHKDRNMSPKSLRKKVNTFMENVVLKDPNTTAYVFEELCKSRHYFFFITELLIQSD